MTEAMNRLYRRAERPVPCRYASEGRMGIA